VPTILKFNVDDDLLQDLQAIGRLKERNLTQIFQEAISLYLKLTKVELKGGKILYVTANGEVFQVIEK